MSDIRMKDLFKYSRYKFLEKEDSLVVGRSVILDYTGLGARGGDNEEIRYIEGKVGRGK